MAWYKVFAPVTGEVIAVRCYCYRRVDESDCDNDCTPGVCPRCKDHEDVDCSADWGDCDDCMHVVVGSGAGYSNPLDVSSTAGTRIICSMNLRILSVHFQYGNGVCANENGDVDEKAIATFYSGANATGTLIGRVQYCHLNQRNSYISDGQVVNRGSINIPNPDLDDLSWGVPIGKICAVPNGSACYQSAHIHLSASGTNLTPRNSVCGKQYKAQGNWIYKWPVPQ